MIFALCGSHRTGKTTLAAAFAEATGSKFVEISVSKLQKEIGYDSADQNYNFDERLKIQEYLIQRLNDIYEFHHGSDVVVDRSPFDLMGYALIQAGPNITEEQSERLVSYLRTCSDVAVKYCVGTLLVQPGIELVRSDKSAPCAIGYIEHLNSLIFGLINGEWTNDVPAFYIPRHVVDLKKRIAVAKDALAKSMARNHVRKRSFESASGPSGFYSASKIPQ